MYIPRSLSVRARTHKGASHRNVLEISASAWRHTPIVTMWGPGSALSSAANRAFRQRVLVAAAKCLEDGNLETGHHARHLATCLTTEGEHSESVFCDGVASRYHKNKSWKSNNLITQRGLWLGERLHPVRKRHTTTSTLELSLRRIVI
jgi:hypothetical protein